MKPLVIYHANCTDGFGAAFAAWLKLGDEAEYLPMDYGKDYSKSENTFEINERDIYVLDFSFPREVMDLLLSRAKRVVWLDHHKTAFEMWCGGYRRGDRYQAIPLGGEDPLKHYVVLDDNFSGAYLAWEAFPPGTEVPMLIQHIDDRDRWQFKLDGTKEFHAALRSYEPWSFEQWKELNQQLEMWDEFNVGPHFIFKEGIAILRAHNQNVQAALKQAKKCEVFKWAPFANAPGVVIDGFTRYSLFGLAANAPSFLASDLGHELANKSGTFGLVWSMAGDGQIHCSLRSNGDYDVSAIAKAFGGGGHRNAAGFSTDTDTLMGWLK